MVVTKRRPKFCGLWLSTKEHAAAVHAAQGLDLSLAAFLRRAVLEEVSRLGRQRQATARAALRAAQEPEVVSA